MQSERTSQQERDVQNWHLEETRASASNLGTQGRVACSPLMNVLTSQLLWRTL
uniref:Uncharacterized protein n=1 Tax=Peronospora matthiolae TaxID=2874970 RepID=A0AAV1TEB4_9STRA